MGRKPALGGACDSKESIRHPFKGNQAAQALPMTFGNRPRQLRRTIAPYVGQIVIFSLVTLGALSVSIQKGVWGLILLVLVVGWPLFGILVYIGLKYRIYWTEEDVRQQASGGTDVCINYSEIARIALETSKPGEWPAASRPFRRIAIYARESHCEGKFIDVSLKHFVAEDIRNLMRVIHARRPDLTLPKHWI